MAWSTSDPERPLLTASLTELGGPVLDDAVIRVQRSAKPESIERVPTRHRDRALRSRAG